MNKTVIFLFIATSILVLSIICVCVSPIINDILDKFSEWGKFNCQYYADKAKYTKSLDEKFKQDKIKNLCYRQNAMYGLEYSSFIIDLGISFICAQLALLHYFKIGKSFEKITGLIGLIGGAIGFILTLVYVCFSGYIFNNDVAFKDPINAETAYDRVNDDRIQKLYSSGADHKRDGTNKIYIFSDDKSYDSQFVKYKDLGQIQYNYNRKFYEAYHRETTHTCNYDAADGTTGCEYFYFPPYENSQNKYLYDRWCLSLVLAVLITALNAGLIIFGFLTFKNSGGSPDDIQEVKIE